MKRYYIESEGAFWCENGFGFWSKFDYSLKDRFEGIWLWVYPLYLMMKVSKVNCRMVKIEKATVLTK